MFIVVKKNLLSISVMQLRSWSAEHPSASLTSSLADTTVVETKQRAKVRRDIIAVFILINRGLLSLLKAWRVCV